LISSMRERSLIQPCSEWCWFPTLLKPTLTSHHITSINTSHHITSHQSTHFVINTKQSIQYLSSSFILKMREREREKEENLCYMLNKCDSLCNECIDNWFPWYLFHHKLNNSLLCVSFPNLLSYLVREIEVREIMHERTSFFLIILFKSGIFLEYFLKSIKTRHLDVQSESVARRISKLDAA
jgi:hypothetical protein